MDYSHTLVGNDIEADNEKGILHITGNAFFNDPDNGFKEIKDPKAIIFLTTSNLNVKLLLKTSRNEFNCSIKDLLNST
jgi:hypothetical protein